MRKTLNREKFIGKVYDHKLVIKQVQNQKSENYGKEFIAGTIDIATDEDCLNIVQVHYTYVPPVYNKSGKKNYTFDALKKIITENKTVINVGKDEAVIIKAEPSLEVNDFYSSRTGELVSVNRNEGGFASIVKSISESDDVNSFEVDFLINGTQLVEADEERHISQDYLKLKGAVFNYNKMLQPVELVVKEPEGINFFESLEINPNNLYFVKTIGFINSETTVIKVEEESAWGQPIIKEYPRSHKEWVVNKIAAVNYEIGDEENGITLDELKEAMAAREIHLAEVRKNAEEYQAKRNAENVSATAPAAPAAAGGFTF